MDDVVFFFRGACGRGERKDGREKEEGYMVRLKCEAMIIPMFPR